MERDEQVTQPDRAEWWRVKIDTQAKQLIDAQATIAALQADKGKLYEERNRMKDMLGRIAAIPEVDEGYHAPNEECIADGVEALVDEYHDCKQQLTQRTAELEAVNKQYLDLQAYQERLHARLGQLEGIVIDGKGYYIPAAVKAELERVRGELAEMRERKDGAYLERNRVVAALASCFPSGISRTAIEGWHDDWHGCVYIDLPTGQVSWHYHDSHAHLFAHLPPYTKQWDGHTTEEKYERVALLQHRQGMEG